MPRVLIPSHVRDEGSAEGLEGVTALLDEATKAYIFGLPLAAISMCRALCEKVLVEFYFKGMRPERDLKDIVWLAEGKYAQVRKLDLREHIRKANRVLHDYKGDQLSENELGAVEQFLMTAKSLIEQAPRLQQAGMS